MAISGQRHLAAVIGSELYQKEYIEEIVSKWRDELLLLTKKKLFLRPPRPTDQTAIFQNKFTLWYIGLNIFIRKTKFSSHKQYLFGPLFSINTKKNHADQSIVQTLLLCLRRNISQTYKSSSCKKSLSQVCILLIQLALMNVFYSM